MATTDLTDRLESIFHEDTPDFEYGVDLTVGDVIRVEKPGRVDFGGGELDPADLAVLETERRNPDDDYEWWHIGASTYLVESNESLAVGAPLRVQIHRERRERGAYYPLVTTSELGSMPLTVADGGIRLNEKARISTRMER